MTTEPINAIRLRRRDLWLAILAPLVAARAVAGQSRQPAVRTRPVSTVHFRVNMPDKDWRLLPGGINTLGTLAHKDGGAIVVIEHEPLQIALRPEEVDATFVELEATTIQEREMTGTAFSARVDRTGSPRAVVDYQRRAPSGPERVRVFVLVHGKHLYRLACVAPAGQFARYEPIFQAVSSSFTPLAPAD